MTSSASALLERVPRDQLGQADLRLAAQRLADAAAQRLRVHVDLLEQGRRVGLLVGVADRVAG